ncbi:uncharacterized protein FIBRA_03688 [Fibroporia radiculosa]|uniref:AP complex mu/sigma subunit domain-containing protein n=1 Tax=Fibroporia radiculosa TaxID=599839 RepID=J4HW46_9APHY|nr:uncharacterized protein FIBRA_03688 [Fibroporia radiculosa]CCM01627.1 predicted protein [Fibroporia radiculosa]
MLQACTQEAGGGGGSGDEGGDGTEDEGREEEKEAEAREDDKPKNSRSNNYSLAWQPYPDACGRQVERSRRAPALAVRPPRPARANPPSPSPVLQCGGGLSCPWVTVAMRKLPPALPAPPRSSNMPSFALLSSDVVDRIFVHLPDFNTLAAFLRSSKCTYAVFQDRPKSIVRAVSYNVLAIPELYPAALRLARRAVADYDRDDECRYDPEPGPDEAQTVHQPLSRSDAHELQLRARIVADLEDLFSWRHKDRTASTSRLTYAESLAFRRAMYRFWLLCDCRDPPEDIDFDEIDDAQATRADFIGSFPFSQMLELARVADFVADTLDWARGAEAVVYGKMPMENVNFFRDISSVGPQQAWEAYRTMSLYQPDAVEIGFFWSAYALALERRGVSEDERPEKHLKAIVTSITGEQDTYWPLLRPYINATTLYFLLPGSLTRNSNEKSLLYTYMSERSQGAFDHGALVREILRVADPDAQGADVWAEDEWYCMSCLRALLARRVMLWWHSKKQERGLANAENCWQVPLHRWRLCVLTGFAMDSISALRPLVATMAKGSDPTCRRSLQSRPKKTPTAFFPTATAPIDLVGANAALDTARPQPPTSRVAKRNQPSPIDMIHAVLIFNTSGVARLTKFYSPLHRSAQALVQRIFALIATRPSGLCNFLDAPELEGFLTPPAGSAERPRVVYRSYATLFFVFVVDSAESELGILDLIQVFVESLDRTFENVCELDLVFHFDEVHHILSEVIQGGLVLETNVEEIDRRVQESAKARKESFASANPLSLGGGVVGSRGTGLHTLGWLTERLTGGTRG